MPTESVPARSDSTKTEPRPVPHVLSSVPPALWAPFVSPAQTTPPETPTTTASALPDTTVSTLPSVLNAPLSVKPAHQPPPVFPATLPTTEPLSTDSVSAPPDSSRSLMLTAVFPALLATPVVKPAP